MGGDGMGAKSDLANILEKEIGYPAWLMHTMPADEVYPESFFTFMATDAPLVSYYDNKPNAAVWAFAIGFYSCLPDLVDSVPLKLVNRLRAAGWIVDGLGEDVQSDEPTHTGRRITAYYIEPYKEE